MAQRKIECEQASIGPAEDIDSLADAQRIEPVAHRPSLQGDGIVFRESATFVRELDIDRLKPHHAMRRREPPSVRSKRDRAGRSPAEQNERRTRSLYVS